MNETIKRFEQLLNAGMASLAASSDLELKHKPTPEKWSKIEILGHLIDSGINNLQRFTEIQFENKPYKIRKYSQEGLVKANDYQHAEIKELVNLWTSINYRIKSLMEQQSEKTLNYEIELDEGNFSDLRYLMTDYVNHLEHHLSQIKK